METFEHCCSESAFMTLQLFLFGKVVVTTDDVKASSHSREYVLAEKSLTPTGGNFLKIG